MCIGKITFNPLKLVEMLFDNRKKSSLYHEIFYNEKTERLIFEVSARMYTRKDEDLSNLYIFINLFDLDLHEHISYREIEKETLVYLNKKYNLLTLKLVNFSQTQNLTFNVNHPLNLLNTKQNIKQFLKEM